MICTSVSDAWRMQTHKRSSFSDLLPHNFEGGQRVISTMVIRNATYVTNSRLGPFLSQCGVALIFHVNTPPHRSSSAWPGHMTCSLWIKLESRETSEVLRSIEHL